MLLSIKIYLYFSFLWKIYFYEKYPLRTQRPLNIKSERFLYKIQCFANNNCKTSDKKPNKCFLKESYCNYQIYGYTVHTYDIILVDCLKPKQEQDSNTLVTIKLIILRK